MLRAAIVVLTLVAWIAGQVAASASAVPVHGRAGGSMSTQSASSVAAMAAAGMTRIVLCTQDGIVVIDLTEGVPTDLPPDDTSHCKWCKAFGHIGLPTAQGDPTPIRYAAECSRFQTYTSPRDDLTVSLGFSPRAPPI